MFKVSKSESRERSTDVWGYQWVSTDIHSLGSNHRKCSIKKGVIKDFVKFRRKHQCQNLFFRPQACNFNRKETLAQVFSCWFCEIFKDIHLTEHLRPTASVHCWDKFVQVSKPFFSELAWAIVKPNTLCQPIIFAKYFQRKISLLRKISIKKLRKIKLNSQQKFIKCSFFFFLVSFTETYFGNRRPSARKVVTCKSRKSKNHSLF